MTYTKRFATILTVVTTAFLVFVVVTVHFVFADGDDEVRLDGPGVITVDNSNKAPIVNGVRRIIQGTRIDGECVIKYHMSLGPDEEPKVARTLAFNPNTCEELIEQGTLTSGQSSDAEVRAIEEAIPASKPGLSAGSEAYESSPASSLPSKTKTFKAAWEDLIQLDVNWQKTKIEWEYVAQNNVVDYLSGQCKWWWRSSTGWTADSDKECWRYSKANDSQYVVEASRGFTNTVFVCSASWNPDEILQGANTRMDYQTVTAYSNGGYSGDVDFSKCGDCAWLLDPETRWE